VLFASGVKKFVRGAALMNDGRVLALSKERPPEALALPPAIDMDPNLALTATGELWSHSVERYVDGSVRVEPPALIPNTGAVRLLGDGYYARRDGSVGLVVEDRAPLEMSGLRGATACAMAGCLVHGKVVLLYQWDRVIDVGGAGVEIGWGTVRRRDGRLEHGYSVLRSDGVVVHVPGSTTSEDPQITTVSGLPPIAHVFDGYYQDREGRVWTDGLFTPGYVGRLVAGPVATAPCTYHTADPYKPLDEAETCRAAPIELTAVRGARPSLGHGFMALYPDGRLVCWPYENDTCPRGEGVLTP
jgi:hypothetical protein